MLSAAGPSAVPLLVELTVAVLAAAGLLARRPLGRAVAALRRTAARPRARARARRV